MTLIKCDNCGKLKEEPKIIKIGKEEFYICKECEKIVEKFKERYRI